MSDLKFKKNEVQSQSGPHKDYEKNLAMVNQFIQDNQALLPAGMSFRWDKTNHEYPRQMLIIAYRRKEHGSVPSFANHVGLDDHTAECKKNLINTYEHYLKLAEKWNFRIHSKENPVPENAKVQYIGGDDW